MSRGGVGGAAAQKALGWLAQVPWLHVAPKVPLSAGDGPVNLLCPETLDEAGGLRLHSRVARQLTLTLLVLCCVTALLHYFVGVLGDSGSRLRQVLTATVVLFATSRTSYFRVALRLTYLALYCVRATSLAAMAASGHWLSYGSGQQGCVLLVALTGPVFLERSEALAWMLSTLPWTVATSWYSHLPLDAAFEMAFNTVLYLVLCGSVMLVLDAKRTIIARQLATVREAGERALQLVRAKTQMIGLLSHELRTPLSGVLGALDALLDLPSPALTEAQAEAVHMAHSCARALLSLSSRALQYMQYEQGTAAERPGDPARCAPPVSGTETPAPLHRIVDDAVRSTRVGALATEGGAASGAATGGGAGGGGHVPPSVTVRMDDAVGALYVCRSELVLDLLINLLRFAIARSTGPQPGTVELSVTAGAAVESACGGAPAPSATAAFPAAEQAVVQLELCVRDPGPPLTDEQLTQCAQPLTPLAAVGAHAALAAGAGFELGIAQAVARWLQGAVSVQRGPGGLGACVLARVRCAVLAAPPPPEAARLLERRHSSSTLTRALVQQGLPATTASASSDALQEPPRRTHSAPVPGAHDRGRRSGSESSDSDGDSDAQDPDSGAAAAASVADPQSLWSSSPELPPPADAATASCVTSLSLCPSAAPTAAGSTRSATLTRSPTSPVGRLPVASARFRGTALVVDDNRVNQAVLQRLLRRLGLQCDSAADGQAALERWRAAAASAAPYAVVLMDLHMPVMDGLTATVQLRREEPAGGRRVPVVAVTASLVPGLEEQCRQAGMDGFIAKPVTAEALTAVLVRVLLPCARDP